MTLASLIRKDFLTLSEVAETLGVSIASASRYCTSGQLPCEKLGNQTFVRRSDLKRFERTPVGNPQLVRRENKPAK